MKQGSKCRYYVAKIDISSERERVRGKLNADEREDIHIQVFDLSNTLKRGLNLGFVTLLSLEMAVSCSLLGVTFTIDCRGIHGNIGMILCKTWMGGRSAECNGLAHSSLKSIVKTHWLDKLWKFVSQVSVLPPPPPKPHKFIFRVS